MFNSLMKISKAAKLIERNTSETLPFRVMKLSLLGAFNLFYGAEVICISTGRN